MMKYKAVIFDLYGTLVDNPFASVEGRRGLTEMAAILALPEQSFIHWWNHTLAQRQSGVFTTIESNLKHIFRTLGVQVEGARVATATELRLDFTRRTLTPRPDAVGTLAQLKAAGYKTGLLTNCAPQVPILWEETPFAAQVDVPIFSSEASLMKPDPRVYHLACEQLGVLPQDCLYVGDGADGELTGASQVGMHAVLIHVLYEGLDDELHYDARSWQGPKVSALKEVLALVE